MGKYVFAYKGGGMAQTDEAREAAMAAWGAWFGTLGNAVTDGGNPFGASVTVSPSGITAGGAAGAGGYSIVTADSLDDAAALTKGCPVLDGGGTVEVYEAIPM